MTEEQRHTYVERNRNTFNRLINKRLDRITEQEMQKYIKQYATYPDGARNEPLAKRIEYEVTRRSQMGREIDVLEPGRWTLYSFLIGIFSGAAAKLTGDKLTDVKKPVSGKAIKNTLIGTSIVGLATALVTGGRILSFARFKAGLYAGAQTALAMHKEDMPTDFLEPPMPGKLEKQLDKRQALNTVATKSEGEIPVWVERLSEKAPNNKGSKEY